MVQGSGKYALNLEFIDLVNQEGSGGTWEWGNLGSRVPVWKVCIGFRCF